MQNQNLKSIPYFVQYLPLENLILSNNFIDKIENLPETLIKLDLSSNQIKKLENLPNNLKIIDLSGNQIEIIENIPENLSVILNVGDYLYLGIDNVKKQSKITDFFF